MFWNDARFFRVLVVLALTWTHDTAAQAPTVTGLTLMADRQSPQATGTSIRWTAAASGGVAPYTYKWWVYEGGWRVVQDWTSSATYTWTPTTADSSYRVGVWVRSAGSTSELDERNLSVPFPIQPAVSGLTLTADRPAPQRTGASVRWTATASGGVAPHAFRWSVFDGTAWTELQNWGSGTTYTWTPSVAHANTLVRVEARSAGTADGGAERVQSVSYPIQKGIMALSLTPNRASPQLAGTAIKWTAAASGGTPPYSYKWWIYSSSGWTVLQNWTTKATYVWTPTVASDAYKIGVWARSADNPTETDERNLSVPFSIRPAVTELTLTPDRAAPQRAGTSIRWTATASGGTAPYSFKWWVSSGSGWILLQDWSASPTHTWTPTMPSSDYVVRVWARSAGSASAVEERSRSVSFAIRPGVTALTLTSDRSAPQRTGNPIRWTATPTGGVAPYSYRWWVYNSSGWAMVQDWSPSATHVWTPTIASSSYKVGVWVRSADNATDIDEQNVSVAFPIEPGVLGLTMTPARVSPQRAGTSIKWTASAEGGASPYTFKWWVFDGAAWTVAQNWSSSNSFDWQPLLPGTSYKIRVGARSAGNAADEFERSQDSGAYAVTPGITHLTLSPDQFSPKPVGTRVTWTARPVGGVEPYKYRWWVYNQSGWTLLQDWTPNATYSWTPSTPYSGYKIGVWAKSADNPTDVDERNLSVPFPISGDEDSGPGGQDPGDDDSGSDSCTYSVVPLAVTLGASSGSGEIHVTAPPGCHWTAEVSGGDVIETLDRSDGSGSQTLTFYASSNPGDEPRTGSLTVAGRRVAFTQVGRSEDPTCSYSLSSAVESVAREGGSGTVAIETADDCRWSASATDDWIRVTSGASGTGPGLVTYAADPNPGDSRSTTLIVAGHGLDIVQAGAASPEEPPDFEWSDNPVDIIDSRMVHRPYGPYIWESWPDSHAPDLGECFGNCGAGCSGSRNPCGGRTQWWELQILTEPELIEGSRWQDVLCYGDTRYLYDFDRYRAMGRWVYHGHAAIGCVTHDAMCPEATWLGCLAFAGCGTEWDQDWSYEDVVIASKAAHIEELGPGVCQ